MKNRWYDYDPVLIEVLDLLRAFQPEVRIQAEAFLKKIEREVGTEALEAFYRPLTDKSAGNRWYDHDPLISKAVELLRIVPPETQRQAALRFIDAMRKQGIMTSLATGKSTTSPHED